VTRTRKDGTTFPVARRSRGARRARCRDALVLVEQDISEERRLKEQLIRSERLSAVDSSSPASRTDQQSPPGRDGLHRAAHRVGGPSAVRQDLEQIRRDAARAAQIVHHLLLFRDARRSREVADLNEIVRSTSALRTFDLRTRMVDVREHYSANVPLVSRTASRSAIVAEPGVERRNMCSGKRDGGRDWRPHR